MSLLGNIIVNISRTGYETVGNIKVVSIDTFKQLEVANKVDNVKNSAACTILDKRLETN